MHRGEMSPKPCFPGQFANRPVCSSRPWRIASRPVSPKGSGQTELIFSSRGRPPIMAISFIRACEDAKSALMAALG
jgi:hypothetical protein